jgi:hypothetical protein
MARNTRKTKRSRKVDPVTVEIVRNGVIAVTEEMKTNLMRTAYNMIIYEALDFTTGLFTREGETVSIGIGLPTFIRGMAETVKAKIKHFGIENMKPGDIYVTNDSYTTGSHLNHFTFTLPIFHKGKLVGFSCCMAHWLDVGGVLGGMTTDIYSEGIQIPILKYQDRGKVNQDLLDIIRMNVRLPAARHGRPARAGHGREDRRAAVPRTARPLRPAGGARFHRRDHGSRRGSPRAPGREPFPTASTRPSPGSTTTASRSASASREGQGHRQGRRDDHRLHRRGEAGARLLQFGDHHRLSAARRSPTSASRRRPTIRSTTARSAASR